MKTIIPSQRTSLSFDYENQRELMKEERFAGKQNSAGEMGHRIAKHVYTSANVLEKSTYYMLDAQGNTMATYECAVDENTQQVSYAQTEKFIYGSSRLGVQNCNIGLLGSQNNTYTQTTVAHRIGKKGYELSNHLGNVLSVISDKVIPHSNGSTVDYWLADILQSTDYSPFGVTLSGRNFTKAGAEDFRYGFNGMEMDDEIKGERNSYTTEFRQYDPRIGRWLSCDPLMFFFEDESPYCAYSNNPIYYSDPTGLAPEGGEEPVEIQSDDRKYTPEYLPATAEDGQKIIINRSKDPKVVDKIFATFSSELGVWHVKVQFTLPTSGEIYTSGSSEMTGTSTETMESISNSTHKLPEGASTPKDTEASNKLVKDKIVEVANMASKISMPTGIMASGIEVSANQSRKLYNKQWKAGNKMIKNGASKSRFLATASKYSSKWGKIAKAASKIGRLLGFTSILSEGVNILSVMSNPKSTVGQITWAWIKGSASVGSFYLKANPIGIASSLIFSIGSTWIDNIW